MGREREDPDGGSSRRHLPWDRRRGADDRVLLVPARRNSAALEVEKEVDCGSLAYQDLPYQEAVASASKVMRNPFWSLPPCDRDAHELPRRRIDHPRAPQWDDLLPPSLQPVPSRTDWAGDAQTRSDASLACPSPRAYDAAMDAAAAADVAIAVADNASLRRPKCFGPPSERDALLPRKTC